MTTALERLLPHPRLHELDHVDLAAPPQQVWDIVRHGDLAQSRLTSALFALRTLPDRLTGKATEAPVLKLDDLVSTEAKPGFQRLADDPPREIAIGAIGKVWNLNIPFRHVADAGAFLAFDEPGWIKVAWCLRVLPYGERATRLELELRVDATDDAAWRKFKHYFALIGPFSRYIRKTLLAGLAKDLGRPDELENVRALPGDDLLRDRRVQATQDIVIAAPPEAIWPWLVQMGGGRAGFYSIDTLDNGGVASAREIHPELQHLAVGQIIPATPKGSDGFEVLRVTEPRVLVLGGLFDPEAKQQLPFAAPRPRRFWQVTWTFFLEPLGVDAEGRASTRLHARVRAAFSQDGWLHVAWIWPVHELMQATQLRNLAARAEGRLPRDGVRDILDGLRGAARMVFDFLTPRGPREHWGLPESEAHRVFPGDDLIHATRWGWTHAIEIDAPAAQVWPWIAQIGADRGGFYSYQWLENLAGCKLRNAEAIHPEWQLREGDGLSLHPQMPPLRVVELVPGKHLVAYAGPDRATRDAWVAASWLFLVEPIGEHRCRFISRYRVATSDDLVTRASFGELLVEPVGYAMDRRMLLGVKERAEHAAAL